MKKKYNKPEMLNLFTGDWISVKAKRIKKSFRVIPDYSYSDYQQLNFLFCYSNSNSKPVKNTAENNIICLNFSSSDLIETTKEQYINSGNKKTFTLKQLDLDSLSTLSDEQIKKLQKMISGMAAKRMGWTSSSIDEIISELWVTPALSA